MTALSEVPENIELLVYLEYSYTSDLLADDIGVKVTSQMPSDLVLLTGGTGHIGFRILIFALQAGYHVRAAVRSSAKAHTLKSNPLLTSLNLPASALTFVEIPDFTAEGAYDEAVEDVKYVIHVASPIPSAHLSRSPSESEEIFLKPALQGTLGLLSAAKRSRVRRIIITSSTTALIPGKQWAAMEAAPKGTVYTSKSRVSLPPPPYPTLQAGYCASKAASFNAAEDWVKKENPDFSVIHIHPSFVLGADYLHLSAQDARSGTNMMCLGIALGGKSDAPRVGAAVHLDDVAKVHVGCLDEEKIEVVGGMRSFITDTPVQWQDVVDIAQKDFAEAVKDKLLSADGKQPTMDIPIDASETEAVFGFKFASFESQVKSVLTHFIDLQSEK